MFEWKSEFDFDSCPCWLIIFKCVSLYDTCKSVFNFDFSVSCMFFAFSYILSFWNWSTVFKSRIFVKQGHRYNSVSLFLSGQFPGNYLIAGNVSDWTSVKCFNSWFLIWKIVILYFYIVPTERTAHFLIHLICSLTLWCDWYMGR